MSRSRTILAVGQRQICTPEAAAPPTAPNNAESTAIAIFTIVFQFFIIYLLSNFRVVRG